MTVYLFRPGYSHFFMTTEDPSYRYEALCGYCDYPIEREEKCCPRCQNELEDCPVCSERSHRRAIKTTREPKTGSVQCSLCGIERHPLGRQSVTEIRGSFCTNLYGCTAGGMLTRCDELVVWPDEAKTCLVCQNQDMSPKPAKTFAYHVRRCLFCSTAFALENTWRVGLTEGLSRISALRNSASAKSPCPLCGRSDHQADETTVVSHAVDPWDPEALERPRLTVDAYLKVVELGRALILWPESDRQAAQHLFDLWFDPLRSETSASDSKRGITVAQTAEHLLNGTLDRNIRVVLQNRLEGFLLHWKAKGIELDYSIAQQNDSDGEN